MYPRVFVTGVGAASPLGLGTKALLKGFRAGDRPFRKFNPTPFDLGPVLLVGLTLPPDENARAGASFSIVEKLLMCAAEEAIAQAGLTPDLRIGVVIGTGLGTMQAVESSLGLCSPDDLQSPWDLSGSLAVNLARRYSFRGPISTVTTACSSGSYAFVRAADWIRLGIVDVVVCAGVDSRSLLVLSCFNRINALDPQGIRPFDRDRQGTTIAEGAGVLILESEHSAKTRRVSPLAEFAGAGQTCDAFHPTAMESSGDQIARAIRQAMQEAGLNDARLVGVFAHGTGTTLNDASEYQCLSRVLPSLDRIPVTAIKSMIGHSGGGACALALIAACLLFQHKKMCPTAGTAHLDPAMRVDVVREVERDVQSGPVLVNSFAFGGNNSIVVLTPPLREDLNAV